MWKTFHFLCSTVLCVFGASIDHYQPEQVHLSYTGQPASMTVTWTTFSWTSSVVEFSPLPGPPSFNLTTYGETTLFVDGGPMKRKIFIHQVTLNNLIPGQRYAYHCGSSLGWSPQFYFRALWNDPSWSPRLAVFGDMGNENAQSLSRLQKETQMDMYDAILHVGDFAYDMDKDNARVGDEFMRQIESVAAYVPYMTCPGNHEEAYNFSNYRMRFSMPGDTEGLWYSWDLGPAHIISFSTEVYFYLKYGQELVAEQFKWLQRDLQEATSKARRSERPWIITMAHRPMYCTNFNSDDCAKVNSTTRTGLPGGQYALEELFYKYGVDLEIWAHEHSYERLWPVYDNKVYNGSTDAPYTNPRAPVHITTGSAGCNERLDPFFPLYREWSAVRIEDYGYTRIHISNRTHIHIQQVSDDQNGQIVDDIWLIKDQR
ncbi:PREDICTED: acid phosphatase type 7 [Nanorana parkeri]|uniref:acid phosphatase type 7 n=1 Tax=Nanorana parkeri TaxID=125878 RepID=UPI0008549EBC|nr:PREDICTED: acid phosphatase type 7 [Nanorana parkeri]